MSDSSIANKTGQEKETEKETEKDRKNASIVSKCIIIVMHIRRRGIMTDSRRILFK